MAAIGIAITAKQGGQPATVINNPTYIVNPTYNTNITSPAAPPQKVRGSNYTPHKKKRKKR